MTLGGRIRGFAICKNCGVQLSFLQFAPLRRRGQYNEDNDHCPNCGVTQEQWLAATGKYWEECVESGVSRRTLGLRTRNYELFESSDCGADLKEAQEAFAVDPLMLVPKAS